MSLCGIKLDRQERRELRQISQCSFNLSDAKELDKLLKKHSKKSFSRLKNIFGNNRMVSKIETLWNKVSEASGSELAFRLSRSYTLMYLKVMESFDTDLDNRTVSWNIVLMGIILKTNRRKFSDFEIEVLKVLNVRSINRAIIKLVQCISFSFCSLSSFLQSCCVYHDISYIGIICLSEASQRDGVEKSLCTIIGIELLKTLHVRPSSDWEWVMDITLDISYKVGSVMCTRYWYHTNLLIHCWLDKFFSGMQIDWTKWECFFNHWKFDDVYIRMCTYCGKRPLMAVFERLKMAAHDKVEGKKKIELIAKWIPNYRIRCLWMGDHSLDELIIDLILQTKSSILFEALVSGSKFYELCRNEILEDNHIGDDCSKILKKILYCYKECISIINSHKQLMFFHDDVLYDGKAFDMQSEKVMHTHYDMEKMPICPITNDVPITPVTTFHNRYYEKHALLSWIHNSDGRDPLDPSTILSLRDVKDVDLKTFVFAMYKTSTKTTHH